MDQFYIQVRGIAMGSSAAPSIANLYMAMFEQELIFSESNPFVQNISFYRRYIDDLLIFYTQSNTIQDFINWLNTLDSNIQFSGQFHHDHLPFLDVCIYRNASNLVAVKPFKKQTDKNTYLHYSSFHPRHLKDNLPYGQFLRLKRNSTTAEDFTREAGTLYKQLQKCGYPNPVLRKALQRSKDIPRTSLLQPRRREKEGRIMWALEYTSRSNQIRRIILKHWDLLKEIEGCAIPPQIGFRRTKNLKKHTSESQHTRRKSNRTYRTPKGTFQVRALQNMPNGLGGQQDRYKRQTIYN